MPNNLETPNLVILLIIFEEEENNIVQHNIAVDVPDLIFINEPD